MQMITSAVGALFAFVALGTPGARAETVRATWYGNHFCRQHTASGEMMDCGALTAAHRWLPFGTLVSLFNRSNGSRAVVRINDRKPGGGIDLTPAGRRALGFSGGAPVAMTILSGRHHHKHY